MDAKDSLNSTKRIVTGLAFVVFPIVFVFALFDREQRRRSWRGTGAPQLESARLRGGVDSPAWFHRAENEALR